MSRKVLGLALGVLCLPVAFGLIGRPLVQADPGGCCSCKEKCPPRVHFYQEGPPRLKYRRACPKPICPPCELENWGYYEPCWRPWPFPSDYSHCPVPPVAAYMPPGPPPADLLLPPIKDGGAADPERRMPAPRKIGVEQPRKLNVEPPRGL